jgi:hypothetical protein
MDNGSEEICVVCKKRKREHLLSLLEFLSVDGEAKLPSLRLFRGDIPMKIA